MPASAKAASGPVAGSLCDPRGVVYVFALDLDGGNLWVGQNGTNYSGDPSTGTSPWATGITGKVYPAVVLCSESINAFTADFGASAFRYPVPTGFAPGFF